MVDNKTATLTGPDGTSLDILITVNVEHNMEKELVILSIPKQTPILTYLIDLKRLKGVITINGILLDDNNTSGLEKKQKLYKGDGTGILEQAGNCTLAWGTNSEESYDGIVMKCVIRQIPGRILSGDATQGTRTDTFEIMLSFAVGTFRG